MSERSAVRAWTALSIIHVVTVADRQLFYATVSVYVVFATFVQFADHVCSIFYPRDAMLCAVLPSSCVCPSVCLSQVGVLLIWQNLGPHKRRLTIAQGI